MERDIAVNGLCVLYIYFNSHAHVERDFVSLIKLSDLSNFNSHAHVERDSASSSSVFFISNFNSHAHVERDPFL